MEFFSYYCIYLEKAQQGSNFLNSNCRKLKMISLLMCKTSFSKLKAKDDCSLLYASLFKLYMVLIIHAPAYNVCFLSSFQVSLVLYAAGLKSHSQSSSLKPHVTGDFIHDWYRNTISHVLSSHFTVYSCLFLLWKANIFIEFYKLFLGQFCFEESGTLMQLSFFYFLLYRYQAMFDAHRQDNNYMLFLDISTKN